MHPISLSAWDIYIFRVIVHERARIKEMIYSFHMIVVEHKRREFDEATAMDILLSENTPVS